MTTQYKKIIHCACSLNSEGIPTPFSSIDTEAYPTPPSTPDEYNTPSNKAIPLMVSTPTKNVFDARSSPVWNTINTVQPDYKQQILIESCPMKNSQIDKELYSYNAKVLDVLFQVAPVIMPHPEMNHQIAMWRNYTEINKAYAEAIAARYNKNDLVWIHGHGLLMVPYYLRKIYPGIKIGLSFYAKFPNWEHFADAYGHDLLLKSMLQADHIAFQTSLDTQQFDTACKKLINNTPTATVKTGVFPSVLAKNSLITSSTTNQANSIRHMFSDKQIIFCRGTCVANVYRSLAAFAKLISRNQYLAQHLIFLLHVCPQDVPVKLLESVPELVRQINHIYGTTDSVPVHFYHQEIDKEEQLSLMMAADLGLFLGTNPSTNILAQEFMQLHSDNNSPLILSSNSNLLSMLPNWSFPTLNNTDSITTIVNTLHTALTSPKSSTCSTYEAFRRFLAVNDAMEYKDRFIRKIMTQPLLTAPLITKSRLLLYFDTKKISSSPSILSYLHHLTENPCNSVWIISSQDKNTLEQWKEAPSLGLIAENGAFIKKPLGKKWIQVTNSRRGTSLFPANEDRYTLSFETNKLCQEFVITKYPAHLFLKNDGFVRFLLNYVKPDAVYFINHSEQHASDSRLFEKEIYPTSLLKNSSTLLPCN